MNLPFGSPIGCLPYPLITTCWCIIQASSIYLPFSPSVFIHGLNMHYTSLIMFTFGCVLGATSKTALEVLVRWQIMMRLEEMCLINSTEGGWCAATLFSPLLLAIRSEGEDWSCFSLCHRPRRIYIQQCECGIQPAIENGGVIPVEQKSAPFKWNQREKPGEEREKKGGKRKMRQEIKNAASREPLCMKVEWYLLYFTELNSPRSLWPEMCAHGA